MSQPTADARAVVRALDALTTQVKRIADHTANPATFAPATPVVDTDDTPTTTCDDAPTSRDPNTVRRHAGLPPHPDADARPVKMISNWGPLNARQFERPLPDWLGGTRDLSIPEQFPDPLYCPLCTDAPRLFTPADADDHFRTHHPEQHPAIEPDRDADHTCRIMETRTCPPTYNGPCGDRPCARFESEDPTPWLPPAADEEQQRAARRASLRVLITRVNNGLALTTDEAQLLARHVATEISDANTGYRLTAELEKTQAAVERVRTLAVDTARAMKDGTNDHDIGRYDTAVCVLDALREDAEQFDEAEDDEALRAKLDEATDTLRRVRTALDDRPPILNAEGQGITDYETGWRDHDRMVRTALDGAEQPTNGCVPGPYDDCPNCPHDTAEPPTTEA